MDLRLIEVFCRVYVERSFSRAAKQLQLTQPTVSAHIKELEESLDTPLFNRLGRDTEPTEAGHYLYSQAKEIVTLKRAITDGMADFLGRVEGVLTVGASSVPGECLLPRLITAFHTDYPAVRTRLRITDTGETLAHLRHGDIELGVVGDTVPESDLQFEPFASDTLVLVVPPTPAWESRTRVSMKELGKVPLLVRETGSGTRTALKNALAAKKIDFESLHVAAELGSLGAIKQAVRHGYGVSFISELAVRDEVDAGLLRIATVKGLRTIRRTYYTVVSSRRTLSPLTKTFLGYIRSSAP